MPISPYNLIWSSTTTLLPGSSSRRTIPAQVRILRSKTGINR
ncbi:hypothetical protein CORC01_04533 [Colletotrichum orchidophilum]|uniref:Uncharacterized protein n=1 Tax=Colletotrichum orchidophilum TaxID=1209926 RepID=A0A1G4BFI5_9PEZI|nr:uncharacterized protein CORC01_04533 [Colletotrichum orchidophilum]OHF00125.1 hypothetical protein CORC01_04533 [Colletotrichum orchidophilum]